MAQIRRNLEKKYHALFLALTTDLELASGNMTTVTMTDVKIWHESKSRKIFAAFRKRLEQAGFWVKLKTDEYMINPLVINTANPEGLSQLYKTYLAKGGVRIILDQHLKFRKETTVVQDFESTLAKEFRNAMNAALLKDLRERNETVERLENKIDDLQKEMVLARDEATERHNLLYSMLSPAKQEEAKSHLKLVPNES